MIPANIAAPLGWVARGLGIDPLRYWLLVDLFGLLSDRGEIMDQLGTNGVALKVAAWMYAVFSVLLTFLLLLARPPLSTYLGAFLFLTAFLLLTILLSEAANSLLNPAEGPMMAHQPVNGATYTAAKLTHLLRVVLYLAPAINALPAAAGLVFAEARWSYPLLHLAAALATGLVSALLCCALYGWMMRLLPPARLKAAGQFAGLLPMMALIWLPLMRQALARVRMSDYLPQGPAAQAALGLAAGAGFVAAIVFGIRSLSADYLLRVSTILHAGSKHRAGVRRNRSSKLWAKLFPGQGARAGFAFVSRMARRDFAFRRQALPMLACTLLGLAPMIRASRTDPFSGQFTPAHLFPHVFGLMLLFVCALLPYGTDYKAAWVFQAAPAGAMRGFVRGVHGALFALFIALPHAILAVALARVWGLPHAALFTAFSAATTSLYLALEIRLVDGVPFCRQPDVTRSSALLPVLILGGAAAGVVVLFQHVLVFRGPWTAAAVAATAALGSVLLTRASLRAFEETIRYNLGLMSAETGALYQEIN